MGDDLNTVTYQTQIYCDHPQLNVGAVPSWRAISDAKPKFTFEVANDDGGPVYQKTTEVTVSTPSGKDG